MLSIPRAVSAYMAKIGSKGGAAISPEEARKRAAKGGLARAKKNRQGRFARKPK